MSAWSVLGPLIGYAVGTLQVLLVDWVRGRLSHRRDLVTLRAELRRLAGMRDRFGWGPEGPESDQIPKPPRPLSMFVGLVAGIDFTLTDEHDEDNSQMALLHLVDGTETLQYYWDRADEYMREIRASTDATQRTTARNRAKQLTVVYDETLERLQFLLEDAIREVDRRIRLAALWEQVKRLGRSLPKGENPPPLVEGDPRLRAARDAAAERLPDRAGRQSE